MVMTLPYSNIDDNDLIAVAPVNKIDLQLPNSSIFECNNNDYFDSIDPEKFENSKCKIYSINEFKENCGKKVGIKKIIIVSSKHPK